MRSLFHSSIRAIWLILSVCVLVGCDADRITDDPNCYLHFSQDTVLFDTVFTTIGSSTKQLMVRNPNKNALEITKIHLTDGRYFRVNINGEPMHTSSNNGCTLSGNDSLYVFLRATINPQDSRSPVLIRDTLVFTLRQRVQQVIIEAYGQDVCIIRSQNKRTEYAGDYTFSNDKPYLLYDSVLVGGTLTIEEGSTLYMHQGAALFALGNMKAIGSLAQPIYIRGDRMDRLFDSVPYRYAAGMWDGVYLFNYANQPKAQYDLSYVNIEGGNIGLYCSSEHTADMSTFALHNSRIHNHAKYGLVLNNVCADITNTEISNCASYCVYLDGGNYHLVHTTIASYFGETNIRIQSTPKEEVAALYINNLSKQAPETLVNIKNSIITGSKRNQMVLATPLPQYYTGEFYGNYLKTDSLTLPYAHDNVYWQEEDTTAVFKNTFYRYKEYRYYDFQLDSLSPARGIADSITAEQYPIDRVGTPRPSTSPDAGCYQSVY